MDIGYGISDIGEGERMKQETEIDLPKSEIENPKSPHPLTRENITASVAGT